MADAFLSLPIEDRREALRVTADRSGRPAHLLEKDVWVVWALATLFESDIGAHLVLKGGASLSKAYGVIRRFSEDVEALSPEACLRRTQAYGGEQCCREFANQTLNSGGIAVGMGSEPEQKA